MDAPDHLPAADACPSCGGRPRWESVLDGDEERWLALCRCGRMRAFLPEQPALEPEDPLRAFLSSGAGPIVFGRCAGQRSCRLRYPTPASLTTPGLPSARNHKNVFIDA